MKVRFAGSGAAVDRKRVVRAKTSASGGLLGSRGWGIPSPLAKYVEVFCYDQIVTVLQMPDQSNPASGPTVFVLVSL